jgi:Nucleotidyltransferase of unknown function (DUF6036)
MSDIASKDAADRLFVALGEQLAAAGERYELVVIGGSGLLVLGIIERSTRDVDLLALRSGDTLDSAEPLPKKLATAHWSRSHDPSAGYAQMLRGVLTHLGVDDVDLGR